MGKDETLVSEAARPSSSYSDSMCEHVEKPSHAKQFHVRRMRTEILRAGLGQWLVSLILAGIITAILVLYQNFEQSSLMQRPIFNALMLGSSIALALHLASTLRSYAAHLRWRIAASFDLSLRELDLVLGSTSQLKVIKLLFTKRSSATIKILCTLWLHINLVMQGLVALTGLAYNLNERIVAAPGGVSLADLSASGDAATRQAIIHNYGAHSSGYNVIESSDPSMDSYSLMVNSVPNIYRHTEDIDTYFLYRFRDVSAVNDAISIPSSRQISTWAICSVPQVYSVVPAVGSDAKPIPGSLVTYGPDWQNLNATVYVHEWVKNGTTYVSDTHLACGPRCTHVYIFTYNDGSPTLYDCQSKVGQVMSNGELVDSYTTLSDDEARWYAGAIGWAGGPALPELDLYANLQSASFVNSPWQLVDNAIANGNITAANTMIQRFTIGAIAAADLYGPRVDMSDIEPLQGLVLELNEVMLLWILVAILVLQLVGLLLVVMWVGGVAVKDDSYLAVSQLLAPTVMGLGDHGSLLRGEEIASAVEAQKGSGYRVRYGSETVDAVKRAVILEVDEKGQGGRKRFENDLYD